MNRTNFTSETLRLEPIDSACSNSKERESDRTNSLHVQAAVINASQSFQKKKVSSFQITSIRPTSRSSNDGGDDSENDTEDTSDILDSSRVTFDFDPETPSFSEDISKSEDLIGSGPVIPASSQYGITALVQPTGTGGMMTARFPQGVTVNVTEGGLALAKTDGEPDDLDNWQKRFKIVKIDSNKPFKRGRWLCLDFMDSPALNAAGGKVGEMPKLVVSNIVSDSESSEQSGVLEIPFSLSSFAPQTSQSISSQYSGQVSTPAPSAQVHGGTLYTNNIGQPIQVVIPGYTIYPQPAPHGAVNSSTCQAPPQTSATSQSTVAGSNSVHSKTDVSGNGLTSGPNLAVSLQPGVVQQNVPQSNTQPVTVNMQTEQSQLAQGISLAPINSNNGNISQGLSSQVLGISSQSQASVSTNVPLLTQQSQSPQPSASQLPQAIISSQQVPSQVSQPVTSSQQISQNISQQTQSSILQQNSMQNSGNQLISGSCTNVINSAAPPVFTSIPSSAVSPTPVTSPAQAQGQINAGTGQQQLISSESHQLSAPTSVPSSQPPPNTLEGLSLQGGETNATSTATPPTDDAESASTASTVAIDNKIEQAMDLVKSHLMFAVREEVDVLKEKIVELMDRINHLECENNLLRQYASPDVIQQLQSQIPHQMQQPPHHTSTS